MAKQDQSFATFGQWVNHATSWLTSRGKWHDGRYVRAFCFDAQGRICTSGKHFMRARDENAFPIRWIWEDEVDGFRIIQDPPA